jgi:hypothetical protein
MSEFILSGSAAVLLPRREQKIAVRRPITHILPRRVRMALAEAALAATLLFVTGCADGTPVDQSPKGGQYDASDDDNLHLVGDPQPTKIPQSVCRYRKISDGTPYQYDVAPWDACEGADPGWEFLEKGTEYR